MSIRIDDEISDEKKVINVIKHYNRDYPSCMIYDEKEDTYEICKICLAWEKLRETEAMTEFLETVKELGFFDE